MADSASRLSLLSLPPEVLSFIIPDPFRVVGSTLLSTDGYCQQWLAIKKRWHSPWPGEISKVEEALAILRPLSQVCKSLRELTLPKLWVAVHVATVEELGRLRETLRVSPPHIARHIRCFDFRWGMDMDHIYCDWFPLREGTMLELAFRDRFQVWDDLRQQLECPAEWQESVSAQNVRSFRLVFVHEGRTRPAPGRCSTLDPQYDEEGNARFAANRGSGPDGSGEDRLVKSAEDLNSCLVEIVAQLKQLETFAWTTNITSMPLGVFDSLAKLTTLHSLGYWFATKKREGCHLPLWKLAHGLEELSLMDTSLTNSELLMCDEQAEQTFDSFELPKELPKSWERRVRQNFSIALRTVITAARGGRSTRLFICGQVEELFAIRALLPCWMRVEEWDTMMHREWSQSALALRPLLAHASLWHIARKDRLLTRQDVQNLQHRFKDTGVPEVIEYLPGTTHAVDQYLSWLHEDGELAEQVANVWNEVVREGGTNVVRCRCDNCRE